MNLCFFAIASVRGVLVILAVLVLFACINNTTVKILSFFAIAFIRIFAVLLSPSLALWQDEGH